MTVQRILEQKSIDTIRFLAAEAVQKAGFGHPEMPMGAATMAYTLWDRFLKHNPDWPDRARFGMQVTIMQRSPRLIPTGTMCSTD